jgi:lipoprotein-anchoring transpeptidase ErfK/SrfK
VEINGVPQREFHILGRGSTTLKGKTINPTRSPFKYAGNTPTGDYVSPSIVSTTDWDPRSYGPWGAVRLKAVAGDALLAERLGRTGLLIHGGLEGSFDGYRPTLGCLRLHNTDMKQLIQLISNAGSNAQAAMCEAVSVRVTVRQ